MNASNSNTTSRTGSDSNLSSERRTNNYKSMQQYTMNPNIQTNIDQCMDPYIHSSVEKEINMVRPFVYTVLIFLALVAVSYLLGA
jgi:hypothetical protein